MAYGGLKKMNRRRRGTLEETVSKNHIQPEYGDEQADAGRGCPEPVVRPNSLFS